MEDVRKELSAFRRERKPAPRPLSLDVTQRVVECRVKEEVAPAFLEDCDSLRRGFWGGAD